MIYLRCNKITQQIAGHQFGPLVNIEQRYTTVAFIYWQPYTSQMMLTHVHLQNIYIQHAIVMREDDHVTRNNIALFDEHDIAFDDSIWVNEFILFITFDQDFVPFHSVWLCLDSVYLTDY